MVTYLFFMIPVLFLNDDLRQISGREAFLANNAVIWIMLFLIN